jgi:hypothetical protein
VPLPPLVEEVMGEVVVVVVATVATRSVEEWELPELLFLDILFFDIFINCLYNFILN